MRRLWLSGLASHTQWLSHTSSSPSLFSSHCGHILTHRQYSTCLKRPSGASVWEAWLANQKHMAVGSGSAASVWATDLDRADARTPRDRAWEPVSCGAPIAMNCRAGSPYLTAPMYRRSEWTETANVTFLCCCRGTAAHSLLSHACHRWTDQSLVHSHEDGPSVWLILPVIIDGLFCWRLGEWGGDPGDHLFGRDGGQNVAQPAVGSVLQTNDQSF